MSPKAVLKGALLALGLFAAVDASAAHALSLSNAGFETPIVPNASVSTKNPNGTADLHWAGNAPSNGVEIFRSGGLAGFDAYEGNQFGEVQNDALTDSISQTVSGFSNGVLYNFSFAHRGRAGTDTVNFQVKNAGVSIFDSNFTSPNTAWELKTGSFIATGTDLELVFTGFSSAVPGQPGNGNFIDAVSLVEVPGPLPLLGAASAFAYSRRIRRRISKARS